MGRGERSGVSDTGFGTQQCINWAQQTHCWRSIALPENAYDPLLRRSIETRRIDAKPCFSWLKWSFQQ